MTEFGQATAKSGSSKEWKAFRISNHGKSVKEEYQGHVTSSIYHFYEKLFLLKDKMNTDTGRKIAEKREKFTRAYVDEFMAEWDGKDADYEVKEHFDRG